MNGRIWMPDYNPAKDEVRLKKLLFNPVPISKREVKCFMQEILDLNDKIRGLEEELAKKEEKKNAKTKKPKP
jgi:hypothetical protein